jgi:signal transduction histidine kinase
MDKAPEKDSAGNSDSSLVARQLAELRLIYNIGKSLSATLDLDILLAQVVEAAVEITQSEEGLILLPDADSGELTIRAAKNIDDDLVQSLRLPSHDSLAGQVMQSSEPILVNNDSGWEKIKTEYLVKSLIYVPLLAKSQPVGVLGVDNKEKPIVFSEHDLEILAALASYAAIAIENAQLYENAVTRARELALLAETASAVSSSLDLNQVLDTISRQIAEGLEMHQCRITLWNQEEDILGTLVEYRAAAWERGDGPTSDLSLYPQTLSLLREGTPFTIDADSDSDDPSEQILLKKLGAQRMLALPLTVGEEIIGLARFYRDTLSALPFAAIDKSSAQRGVQKVTPLLLGSHVRPHWRAEILAEADTMLEATHGDWCTFSLWNIEANLIWDAAEFGNYSNDTPLDGLGKVYPVANTPIYYDVLKNQRPKVVQSSDHLLSPNDQALLNRWRAHTLLVIPLVFKDQTIGLLELGDMSQERTFFNRELKLAGALANQAATAIENARLFSDLGKSVRDLQSAQSQLVHSARMSALGELAAVVAHQIKNPLTTIMGDAEILTQDLPGEHPNHESAAAILRAGQRAKTVVDRLLNIARPTVDMEPLDVNETIQATLALLSGQLQSHGGRLQVYLSPNLPKVIALPGQLEDVWLNLLLNARDTLHETGPGIVGISSGLVLEKNAIQVTVWDTGKGISEENLERIFDPFFTTKPHGKGTGLGLYICQQIVERHKGWIEVASHQGEGTLINVWLPLHTNAGEGEER